MAATNALYPVTIAPGNAQGYLEDISKAAVINVDPADAILYKTLAHRPVGQLRFDWVTDALTAVTSTPAPSVFDADPTTSGVDDRARPYNYVEWFWKPYKTAQAAAMAASKGFAAGVPDEVRRQINNATKFLLKTIEFTLLSEQAAAADDDSTGADLQGFFSAISTNMTDTAAVSLVNAIDETAFQDKVVAVYNAGGDGDLWCVAQPAFIVQTGRTFKGRDNVRETVARGDRKVDTVLERYAAPVGGLVTLAPNRTMTEGVALISKNSAAIGVFQDVNVKDLSAGKVHPQGIVQAHVTLIWDNEKVHGGWRNANTAT